MDVSEATTAVAIDLMEKANLITRQRDPAHRNSVRVKLATEGRRLKRVLLPIAVDVNEHATLGFAGPGLEELRRAIISMIGNLNAEAEAPAASIAAKSAKSAKTAKAAKAAPTRRGA
jgi:DNA-binding MarR family transcriptional regulator